MAVADARSDAFFWIDIINRWSFGGRPACTRVCCILAFACDVSIAADCACGFRIESNYRGVVCFWRPFSLCRQYRISGKDDYHFSRRRQCVLSPLEDHAVAVVCEPECRCATDCESLSRGLAACVDYGAASRAPDTLRRDGLVPTEGGAE